MKDWTELAFVVFAVVAMGLFAMWVLYQLIPAWWMMSWMMR